MLKLLEFDYACNNYMTCNTMKFDFMRYFIANNI